MKTAMKKLLSLVLVAVLLVSAIPFQASAAEAMTVPVDVYINGEYLNEKSLMVNGTVALNEATAKTLINTWENDEIVRTFDCWKRGDGSTLDAGATLENNGWLFDELNAGYRLQLHLKEVKKDNTSKTIPVYIYVDDVQTDSSSLTLSAGATELTKALGEKKLGSGVTFVKWALSPDANDVTGSTYDNQSGIEALYLYGKTNGGNTGNGGNSGDNSNSGNGSNGSNSVVKVPVYVYINDKKVDTKKTLEVTENVKLTEKLAMSMLKTTDGRTFVKWENNSGKNVTDATLGYEWVKNQDGYYLNMYLTEKTTTTPTTPSNGTNYTVTFYDVNNTEITSVKVASGSKVHVSNFEDAAKYTNIGSGYTFAGWKVGKNGTTTYTNSQAAGLTISGNTSFYAVATKSSDTTNNKFPYKVYLHIYKDNKVDDPAKTVDITNGIALDGKVTLAEVKTVVKNYYTAKNSDGIGYDGMYLARGNWVGNFVNDTQKYTTIEDTNEMRKEAEVHINVMITNANAKSSSTADSSNPKTGDTITMTMTVMTISASALALVYFFNKKRAIVK